MNREPPPEVRTREIRAEIEQTREEMSETVNAIQDRLRPGNLASNAADNLREAASERVRDIAESEPVQYARSNPIPTAMVGIGIAGLAWLAFSRRESSDYSDSRYQGTSRDWRVGPRRYDSADAYRGSEPYGYGSGSSGYGGRTGTMTPGSRDAGLTSSVSSRAGEMASDLSQRAEHTSRRARQTAYRAQSQVQRTWEESPLLIGAAAAVMGALIGSAVPETERENHLMGEARDSMVEGVEQAVKDKVEQVQSAATDAVQNVQKAVGLAPETDASSTKTGTAGRSTGKTSPGSTNSPD
jgi:hypothetical protein